MEGLGARLSWKDCNYAKTSDNVLMKLMIQFWKLVIVYYSAMMLQVQNLQVTMTNDQAPNVVLSILSYDFLCMTE